MVGVRTMFIAFVILSFSVTTSLVQNLGIFPHVTDYDKVGLNSEAVQQMTQMSSSVQGSDSNSGYMAYFATGVKILLQIVAIVLGVIVVAVPLYNLGVNILIAAAIQTMIWGLAAFDMLILWRGIDW